MPQPIDILDERERMGGPLAFAIFLHIGVVVFVIGYGLYAARLGPQFGDPNASGGTAVTVTPVQTIPIPHRQGPENPVANDTNTVVPSAPAKQEVEKQEPVPDKNAVAIPDRTPK